MVRERFGRARAKQSGKCARANCPEEWNAATWICYDNTNSAWICIPCAEALIEAGQGKYGRKEDTIEKAASGKRTEAALPEQNSINHDALITKLIQVLQQQYEMQNYFLDRMDRALANINHACGIDPEKEWDEQGKPLASLALHPITTDTTH
jgi:hypothetical protein